MTVWKALVAVPPTEHGFKYRLVYALEGQRIVGFDNERGKGDHMHVDGIELPYLFTSLEQLIMKRTLTITTGQDWRAALRAAGQRAAHGLFTGNYQGESLNFESPVAFFGQLSERRWLMVREMMGCGTVGVRELARRLERDVKRVHEDAQVLVKLGLLEKDDGGALRCPFDDIHVDMHVKPVEEVA